MEQKNNRAAKRSGKVLAFEQNGDFYFRSGLSKLDNNDLPGAMASYRMALEKDPANDDAALGIAEILTGMERYDESNRLLLVRFRDADNCPPEAYFGMGCNFMALREYEQAGMSLDRYLDAEPEGEFSYDAYDMLDAMADGDEEPANEAAAQDKDHDAAELGRRMMELEDFDGAIKELEAVVEKDPDMHYARNNLALAYYCMHDYDKATEQVGAVLKKDPTNLQAHCNLAIFMRGAKDDVGLKRQIEFLKNASPETVDDLNHTGVTLMEVREFAMALPLLKKLAQKRPYDHGTMHRLALCAYYTGDYALASRCYDKLLLMDKNDSIARYYRGICRAAAAGAPRHMSLMLNYQVPAEEIIQRIRRINDYIHMPAEELKMHWRRGSDLETLVKWGLTLPDASVKRAMLSFIAAFRDRAAEDILRDFVLQREQSTELKRDAFGLLKAMDAKEPYLSYINGDLMESRVNLVPMIPKGMPRQYGRVIEICAGYMKGVRSEECITAAVKQWSEYVENLSGYRPLSNGQAAALAAAIEYEACRKTNVDVTKWELCSKYGVSIVRFNNALTKLEKGENAAE